MKNINLIDDKVKIDVKSLFEFSKIVNQDVSIDYILNYLLLTVMGKLVCNQAIVFLKDDQKQLNVRLYKGFNFENAPEPLIIPKIYKKLFYINKLDKTKNDFTKFLKKYKIQYLIPLSYRDEVLGYLGLSRYNDKKLSKPEIDYLNSIVNIAASALKQKINRDELIHLNKELDHKIHQMNTLFEMSKEFSSIFEMDRIIKLFTLTLMGQIGITKYGVFLKDKNEIKLVASRLPENFKCEFLKKINNFKNPLRTHDLENLKLRKRLDQVGIKAIVPMTLRDEVRGILLLGDKMNTQTYTDSELEYLYSLSNITIISLENSRLFNEAIEKQKLEDELEIAREIQYGLFPKVLPVHKNLDIFATNIPSKIVGGDYYDVIKLDENQFVFAIADVSGKGMPASLLMASIHAMFNTLIRFDVSPSDLVKKLNNLIFDNTATDRFISFFYGIYNTISRSFKYVNAGHNLPILLKRDGRIIRLEKGGILLGVTKDNIFYEEGHTILESGDVLLMFTDGITEAMNADSVEFGEERLINLLTNFKNKSSKEITDIILDEVKKYGGENLSDDITLMFVKIK